MTDCCQSPTTLPPIGALVCFRACDSSTHDLIITLMMVEVLLFTAETDNFRVARFCVLFALFFAHHWRGKLRGKIWRAINIAETNRTENNARK